MKGQTGTSMQGIEYAPKRGNIKCNECKFLISHGGKYPFWCSKKDRGRHWTSKVYCKQFEKINHDTSSKWDKYKNGGYNEIQPNKMRQMRKVHKHKREAEGQTSDLDPIG